MRYIYSTCLCFSSLVTSSAVQAFQLQYRAYQSLAKLSHRSAQVPTVWNGAYLNGAPQVTSQSRSADQTALNSLGHELSLGTELYYPYVYLDVGMAQTYYYPGPDQKIEDLAPKAGLQVLTNVQDRWMPFARVGLSQHHLKLISNRVESRSLPPTLGLTATQDRFAVKREWQDNPRLWNADASLGCKLYPVPTTAIIVEYRYSQSLGGITIREKETGTSSFANDAGFTSERELPGVRLTSQELSLAIEVEL
ncbi:MAG TPA: hypothetical protein VE954_12120 [Oligoflexus sp.]|uniref:hypothetical protein n=1 Tax=Oligoflexus sp. TaxID=1971216 RepID=UPI002D6984DE|nr:hypothetical protein [Oligoflexus sp.]HYX33852.1 hypothetical protein [Oligoflexus sp.]